MLGKLIKHEWKDTYKMGCLMLFITLLVTVMGWLSFQSPMWKMNSDSYYMSLGPLDFISIIVLLMYVFMLAGISYAILIYIGVHFYKTMYTDQGYLTHTLPVGKHQILCSKLLVNGLWLLFVNAAVILSAIVVFGSLIGALVPDGYAWIDFWKEFTESLGMLFIYLDLNQSFYLVVLLFSALIGPFASVAILFGSITLGQIFSKARVLMAILCYVGVGVVNSLVSSVVQSLTAFSSLKLTFNISFNSSIIVQLIAAVLLYFAAYQILTKKLNLE